MEMSSSRASQCRPRLLMRTWSRCSGVLCRSRGNHARGTPMMRPSLRSTHMLSASKWTRVGRMFTCVASAEEFIPCPLDPVFVRFDDLQQLAESAGIVAIIVGQPDFRFQPEFCFDVIFIDVDMNRLTRRSFIGIEEKCEPAITEDHWHNFTLPQFLPTFAVNCKGKGVRGLGEKRAVRFANAHLSDDETVAKMGHPGVGVGAGQWDGCMMLC